MTSARNLVSAYNAMLATHKEEDLEFRLRQFFHEDSFCHEAQSLPWGGTCSGAVGFVEMFAGFGHSMELASNSATSGTSVEGEQLTAGESSAFREHSLIIPTSDGMRREFPCIERYAVDSKKIRSIAVHFIVSMRFYVNDFRGENSASNAAVRRRHPTSRHSIFALQRACDDQASPRRELLFVAPLRPPGGAAQPLIRKR